MLMLTAMILHHLLQSTIVYLFLLHCNLHLPTFSTGMEMQAYRMHQMRYRPTCHLLCVVFSPLYIAYGSSGCHVPARLRVWLFAFDAEVCSRFHLTDVTWLFMWKVLPSQPKLLTCCVLPKKRGPPFSCSCKPRWRCSLLVYLFQVSNHFFSSSDRWTVHVLGAPIPTPPFPFFHQTWFACYLNLNLMSGRGRGGWVCDREAMMPLPFAGFGNGNWTGVVWCGGRGRSSIKLEASRWRSRRRQVGGSICVAGPGERERERKKRKDASGGGLSQVRRISIGGPGCVGAFVWFVSLFEVSIMHDCLIGAGAASDYNHGRGMLHPCVVCE